MITVSHRQADAEVREAVHRLRSIDPADEDYSDLAPIGKAIGDADVVFLGEQGHRDGASITAKVRLVKYLHQELGFSTLAFEAGLYSCYKADLDLQAGVVEPMEALGRGLHSVWLTEELVPLAEYLAASYRSSDPLRLAGFDCQFSSLVSLPEIGADLRSWFNAVLPCTVSESDRKDVEALAWMAYPFAPQLSPARRSKIRGLLHRLGEVLRGNRAAFTAVHGAPLISLVERLLPVFLENDELYYHMTRYLTRQLQRDPEMGAKLGMGGFDDTAANFMFNTRDRLMADNLAWIQRSWRPGTKVIGWLANGHAMRSAWSPRTTLGHADGLTLMGEIVHQRLGARLYTIAPTAHHGVGTTPSGMAPIPPSPPGSLEDLLHATGVEYGFVDLRGLPSEHGLRADLEGFPWMAGPDISADWSGLTDGLLYLDTMSPSHPTAQPEAVVPEPEGRDA